MQIDRKAPLVGRAELLIRAPLDQVWRAQADIAAWPTWQPDVKWTLVDGPLQAGTRFRWHAGGLNIVSILQVVEPPHRIGWTGVSLGMAAVHLWSFEETPEGVRAVTEESLSGWLAHLLKLTDRRFLEKSLHKSLELLRARVEQDSSRAG